MRVVLLNQYYAPDRAATAQMLADLGSGLAAEGHEVIAVAGKRAYDERSRRYAAREAIDGVDVRRVAATGFGRGTAAGRVLDYATYAAGALLRLATLRFAGGRAPDVVIVLSTPPMIAAAASRLAPRRGAATVLWSMDVYPDLAFALGALRPESTLGRVVARTGNRLLRRVDAAVALGPAMAARLRVLGARRVVTIHNWADGNAIRPFPAGDGAVRRAWGWDARFVVAYSGNLGLAHDVETLLDAAALLSRERRILFAFIGGGERFDALRRRVAERGLPNVEVRPAVERERLGETLGAADVHLVTLRPGVEGLLVPSKIYGILAAGRPALYVGPDAGEVRDIVRESGCGIRVANGDAEALAREILAYAADPDRCAAEGSRAREAFDRLYTKERGIREFGALLDSLRGPRPVTIGETPMDGIKE